MHLAFARTILAALVLALIAATAAEAQRKTKQPNDAWCRDMQTLYGSVMVCRAFSYEQCMASRTSHVETCYRNPLYDPRFKEWRARNPHY